MHEGYGRTSNDKIICGLTAFMFASLFIFELFSWGKYVFLIVTILVALIHFRRGNGDRIRLPIESYQQRLIAFALFCFASAVWAWDRSSAIQSGITIAEIVICYSVFYSFYMEDEKIELLLSAIKWGAYIVAIYTIVYYGGLSAITYASRGSELRLLNSFSNVNEVGMLSAIACILQLDEYYRNKKINWSFVFVIPAIMVVAATQSRKAFVLLIFGVAFLMILKSVKETLTTATVAKILVALIALYALFKIISLTGIFSGTLERFSEDSTSSSNGNFFYNPSTLRGMYKLVGWEQFLKNPILGIGMGSSVRMIKQAVGISTYTHDNYIEMMSSGGIVGFLIYYSMYFYLLKKFVRFRKLDVEYSDVCLVLLVMLLIADTALVSFSSKERYIYLMLFFIEARRIDFISREIGESNG